MIKSIFQKLLHKSGKEYQIDSRIPSGLFYLTLFQRVVMLLRGIWKTRRKVFIGAGTSLYHVKNIHFGQSVTIDRHCVIDGYASEPIQLGDCVKIGAFSTVSSTSHLSKLGIGLKMGNHSAVGMFTEFGAAGGIVIGSNVIMGSYVSFHSENHNFADPDIPIRLQGVTSKGITIGDNVWVGAKVTFLDGCRVGNHCVVAAGAVVNGDYPDHCVIGGVPAKVLKMLQP